MEKRKGVFLFGTEHNNYLLIENYLVLLVLVRLWRIGTYL
jgi:hypothetical protein